MRQVNWAAALLGATAAACAAEPSSTSDASRFQEGIPSSQEVALTAPVSPHKTSPNSVLRLQDQSTSGDYATYYRLTREMFDGVNKGTGQLLATVWLLVRLPPTTLSEAQATWGPWSEALSPAEWQFRATETSPGEFSYVLEGRDKNVQGPFTTVWNGFGCSYEHPRHGEGWFELDFDAANRIDPARLGATDESGKIKLTYQLSTFPTTIRAVDETVNSQENFSITVTTERSGGGRVDIDALLDVDENHDTKPEDVVIRSRWMAAGDGRADVTLANGDLPASMVVQASECWSSTFMRVFYQDNYSIEPTAGEEGLCAFQGP